jgi:hypothetical protein
MEMLDQPSWRWGLTLIALTMGIAAVSIRLRASARAAFGNGTITQAQYVDAMQRISGWEQAQNSLAKATLRNGGDYFPV